jgi:hypothetical protein
MACLTALESELGIRLTDSAPIWFRDDRDRIRSVTRDEFRRMAAEGTVGPETRVFDLSVTDIGAARAGRLERTVSESWHSRLI